MKSKKLEIYQIKSSGSFTFHPTQANFKQKDTRKYGLALGKNISNERLGKAVREMFLRCD